MSNFNMQNIVSLYKKFNKFIVFNLSVFVLKFIYGTNKWQAIEQFSILKDFYNFKLVTKTNNLTRGRIVVVMTDNTLFAGLADRLRCMISAYAIALENNLEIYIYHDKAFKLTKYLKPNKVDWEIDYNNINNNFFQTRFIWYKKTVPVCKMKKGEYHCYGLYDVFSFDPNIIHKYNFCELFNALFSSTKYLNELICSALDNVKLKKSRYVSVHIRFLNFFEPVEPCAKKATATIEEQEQMIRKVHHAINIIKQTHELPILLFSDSNKFLNTPHPPYVKVIPGCVGHICRNNSTDAIDKAFTDMFVMASSTAIYSIQGENIYGGNYSKIASQIGGIPFNIMYV